MDMGSMQENMSGMVQTRAFHTTHMRSFTGVVSMVIPSKRAFSGRIEFIVEVDVLAAVVEVVAHVHFWRGT